jgi:hypothetical protein
MSGVSDRDEVAQIFQFDIGHGVCPGLRRSYTASIEIITSIDWIVDYPAGNLRASRTTYPPGDFS